MRLSNVRFVFVAVALASFASLAGCAAPVVATRGADTAVRAEPRRISDGSSLPDALRPGVEMTRRQSQLSL